MGKRQSSTLRFDLRHPRLSSIEGQYKTFERSVPHIWSCYGLCGLSTGCTRFHRSKPLHDGGPVFEDDGH